MFLLDSNIVIFATKPDYNELRDYLATSLLSVSAITYLEVMGYHLLQEQEKILLEKFFNSIQVFQIDSQVIISAVNLRQRRKMSLGDSLIAATALVYDSLLVTNNVNDFSWIDGLKLHNPIP